MIKLKKTALFLAALMLCALFTACANTKLVTAIKYAENGLEFRVNEDRITCTIVGMGKCTDTEVEVPENISIYKVTAIGKEAFCGEIDEVAAKITKVTLPEGVQSIGERAFQGCRELTAINLPNSIKEIGLGAFWDCSSLDNVIIPNSLSVISSQTFYACTSLSSIVIPDSVKSIEEGSFTLSGVRTVTIGSGVEYIEGMAFAYCEKLEEFYYNGSIEEWRKVTLFNLALDDYGIVIHCSDGDCTRLFYSYQFSETKVQSPSLQWITIP